MVGDYRYFPITIMHVQGQPSEAAMDFLFLTWRQQAIDHALENGLKIANIVKMTQMSPPSATARKRAGEHASKDASNPGLLCTNLVVSSALVRGVLTAISWVAGTDNAPTTHARSIEHALKNSCRAFEQAGMQPPEIESYTPPPGWEHLDS